MPLHLNTAGAGLMPSPVLDAMTSYLREEADGGAYEAEQRHAETLESGVYATLARVLDASVDDLALFDSATRAWCSVIGNLPFPTGARVWVTPYEYAGNLIMFTELRRRYGLRIEVVPTLADGDLDLDWMARAIDDDVALVSVTHVPSGCGLVNPVEAIGKILEPWPCYYAVDACQSVGQLPVSVSAIRCDLLTGAGRKFLRGPRGTGFAFIGPRLRSAVMLPFHDLHVADMVSDVTYEVRTQGARRFELAERGNAAVVGFDAALGHHLARTDTTGPGQLREAIRSAVEAIPGTRLIDPGSDHAGIVTFLHERVPAARIRAELADRGVNVWIAQGSHTPIFMRERGVDFAVRVSPHYHNEPEDVDVFGRALREIVR